MEKERSGGRHWASQPAEPSVQLRFGPWNLGFAVFILIFTGVTLWLNRDLFWKVNEAEKTVFCAGFLVSCLVMGLGSAVLCVVETGFPLRVRQILGWALTLAFPLGAFYAVDLINGTRVLSFPVLKILANYLCFLMAFALFYAATRRAWAAVLLGGGSLLLFGVINCFVIQFRGQPILPWDISAAPTALDVVGGYRFTATRPMIVSLFGLLAAVTLCARLGTVKGKEISLRAKLAERLTALGLSVLLAILIFPCDLLTGMGVSVWAWNQKTSSELTGVLAGFYANVQFLLVDKPEGYSPEAVEDLSREISAMEEPAPLGTPGTEPTIIVVMAESMTDLRDVGGLKLTRDALPFLHSLQQSGKTIWGTAYASVFGGNTCNSEYEFLTGNTTGFFPSGSKPFQQHVKEEQTALPSILKSHGYACTAIHPGNRKAWQRDTAYPFLGFDKFLSSRNFTVQMDSIRKLTSDATHYEQILYELRTRKKSTPQFYYTVTIQNHGGYEEKDFPAEVQVKGREGRWKKAEQYLTLIRESDRALEGFLSALEEEEDPVLVLFFGDHWPSLEPSFFSYLLDADVSDLEFRDVMREYQVPFVIWANYPLKGQHVENISINYLSGLLLRAAGLEGTGYTRYLENLRRQLPVITAVGIMDREGNLYRNGEETPWDDLLNEYAVLQYNNAFGGEEKLTELFARE